MKRRLFRYGLYGLGLLVVGFLVISSGLIPIRASSKHWAVTYHLLDYTKRRSVATHTLGGEPLKLEDPALALKGAGHYLGGCQPCHADPANEGFAKIMQGATPSPPPLKERVVRWEPDELFFIVKHGIKFTGMPAWPTLQRDDEVTAVVAFLTQLPRLDPPALAALYHPQPGTQGAGPIATAPGVATPAAISESCARCHGADGGGRGLGAFPKLAGQKRAYLRQAMEAFASGKRHSGIMEPLAVEVSDDVHAPVADYYAALPFVITDQRPDPAAIERGRKIAIEGLLERRVPHCAKCHGPAATESRAEYPALAGQYQSYLRLQLQLFHDRRRGGGPYAHLMQEIAPRLESEHMDDLAAFYASLPGP